MKKLLSLCSIVLALSGCATVFSGTTQTIHVQVIEKPNNNLSEGVSCTLMDNTGSTQPLTGNPAKVKISRNGPATITCKKPGYTQINTMVGDSFNSVTLVNVLFWPGFIVDALSGSYKKYPSHYVITMEKTAEIYSEKSKR